jgi:aryl-alcohol dehydrogenase-like predicted oxidoreductase
MTLDQYYLLGRSGLRVSRLALGTWTSRSPVSCARSWTTPAVRNW